MQTGGAHALFHQRHPSRQVHFSRSSTSLSSLRIALYDPQQGVWNCCPSHSQHSRSRPVTRLSPAALYRTMGTYHTHPALSRVGVLAIRTSSPSAAPCKCQDHQWTDANNSESRRTSRPTPSGDGSSEVVIINLSAVLPASGELPCVSDTSVGRRIRARQLHCRRIALHRRYARRRLKGSSCSLA